MSAGDERGAAIAIMSLGIAALRGEPDVLEARRRFGESLASFAELGFTERIVSCLIGLAAAAAPSEPELAARMLGAAEGLRESIGLRIEGWWEPSVIKTTADTLRETLGDSFEPALAAGGSAPEESVREAVRNFAPGAAVKAQTG